MDVFLYILEQRVNTAWHRFSNLDDKTTNYATELKVEAQVTEETIKLYKESLEW
jgi:hypothetical protein